MSTNNIVNLSKEVEEVNSRLRIPEQRCGKELVMPFPSASSGSRKLLHGTQSEQAMPLTNAEVPIIQTGFENEFGRRSTSFRELDFNGKIVGKIQKYQSRPGHKYYLLVIRDDNVLDVIERTSYKHITETFGFRYNTNYLDNLSIGSKVNKGEVYLKSSGFDDYNNRMDGINTLTMYLALNHTTEDAIIVSESIAKKFSSPLIKKISLMINENDILLNIYGNESIYKVIPDIGEPVANSLLAGIRRENIQESLYSQTIERLRDISMSDDKIIANGIVVDIDIRTNNTDLMENSIYNRQLNMYHQDNLRFCKELATTVDDLLLGTVWTLSYDLSKLYEKCKRILGGMSYDIDGNTFSNISMDIYVMEENCLHVGDKLSNRYGGKGVISAIRPDYLMPRTLDGRVVELIFNQATVINRLNPSQLFESEINSASSALIRTLDVNDVSDSFSKIIEFTSVFGKTQANEMRSYVSSLSREEKKTFLKSIIADECIVLSLLPIQENVTIDVLAELYRKFPYTKMQKVLVPMEGSTGQIRYVKSIRPVLAAKQYIYRLKQYAEEKFSVTSMSYTNQINENSRNKSSSSRNTPFTPTPIRFGEMESSAMAHLGNEINVLMLMLYSTAPIARRQVKQLLTDSPIDIDITINKDARSRSAEIVNTYLKAIGLKLEFKKRKFRAKMAVMGTYTYNDLSTPALIENTKYLEELHETNKDLKIKIIKGEGGKYKPIYSNFVDVVRPALIKNALVSNAYTAEEQQHVFPQEVLQRSLKR